MRTGGGIWDTPVFLPLWEGQRLLVSGEALIQIWETETERFGAGKGVGNIFFFPPLLCSGIAHRWVLSGLLGMLPLPSKGGIVGETFAAVGGAQAEFNLFCCLGKCRLLNYPLQKNLL